MRMLNYVPTILNNAFEVPCISDVYRGLNKMPGPSLHYNVSRSFIYDISLICGDVQRPSMQNDGG